MNDRLSTPCAADGATTTVAEVEQVLPACSPLQPICEGPVYNVYEAGLCDEWEIVEGDDNQLNDRRATAAEVARLLKRSTMPISHLILQPISTIEGSLWNVIAVSLAGERDQLNSTPYNAAQVERLVESLSVPVRRLVVQTSQPMGGEGWEVSAVDLEDECDRINSTPFCHGQVGMLIELFDVPVKHLILRPCAAEDRTR